MGHNDISVIYKVQQCNLIVKVRQHSDGEGTMERVQDSSDKRDTIVVQYKAGMD